MSVPMIQSVVRHNVDKKTTKKIWIWTPDPAIFFLLRTLASLVSVNGIFRKLFCRHYVCIPNQSLKGRLRSEPSQIRQYRRQIIKITYLLNGWLQLQLSTIQPVLDHLNIYSIYWITITGWFTDIIKNWHQNNNKHA